jgi:hypothetical protein
MRKEHSIEWAWPAIAGLIIFVLIIGIFDTKCRAKDKIYNVNCLILQKGGGEENAGKFGIIPYKSFLVQNLNDTSEYTELNQRNWQGFTDALYYNKGVGDTLHFKWIDKKRFWKGIKK